MKWPERIDNGLLRAEKALVVGLYAALVATIAAGIFLRLFFQITPAGMLEIGPVLVLWLALIGGGLALKNGRHIKLEFFLRYCPDRFRRGARRMVGFFGMLVMGVLAWASVEFMINEIAIFGAGGWRSLIFPLFFGVAFMRFGIQAFFPDASSLETTANLPGPRDADEEGI